MPFSTLLSALTAGNAALRQTLSGAEKVHSAFHYGR